MSSGHPPLPGRTSPKCGDPRSGRARGVRARAGVGVGGGSAPKSRGHTPWVARTRCRHARRQRRIRAAPTRRRHPPAPPTRLAAVPAGDIAGMSPLGDAIVVSLTAAREDTLLAFLSSGCVTCEGVWAALQDGSEVPGGARIVVVTHSPRSREPLAGARTGVRARTPGCDVERGIRRVSGPGGAVLRSRRARRNAPGRRHRRPLGPGWCPRRTGGPRRGIHARRPRPVHRRRPRAPNDGELLAAGIGPGDPRLVFAAGEEGEEGEEGEGSLPAERGGRVA